MLTPLDSRSTEAPEAADDVLIVGGGLAGLFCALQLAPRPVTVLAAAPIGEGASSAWAQGGVAAAMSPGDSIEKHLADTIAAGAGIVDEKVARLMVADASARVHDLLEYGVAFDRDLEGHLLMSREAAHSERRVVHVRGDMAGAAIMAALVDTVRRTGSIRVLEGYVGQEILMDRGRAAGITARQAASGRLLDFPTRALVLATGGIGRLYATTTNPPEAAATGLGMAARKGAVVADPEFVQFHPTALDVGRDPAPLATEALRGEGAKLVNRAGERFMVAVHPLAELAPRDIVARAIHREIKAGRGAFLDCRDSVGDAFAEHFPTVHRSCVAAGIDPATQPIPIAPAEHFHMGGLLSDARGRTTLDGLWVCGEAASTGAHGANRLASNSLLEAVVFASRVAADLRAQLPVAESARPSVRAGLAAVPESDREALADLRRTMAAEVGVVRDADGLRRALAAIEAVAGRAQSADLLNMAAAAKLIAAAALVRRESRGGHFRADAPDSDPAWQRRTFMTLRQADSIAAAAAARAEPPPVRVRARA